MNNNAGIFSRHVQAILNIGGLDSFDYILLLPHDDFRMNSMLRSAFAAKLDGRRGIIIDDERARLLIELYSLYAFTDKLIIGSFDLPYGRKLRNLLYSGGATEEELISDVILGGMDATVV